MNPHPALLAVSLVLLAAPAPAASGWGEAELRQYLTVTNAYRPLAMASEERRSALPDGSKLTLEERNTRASALREADLKELDALLDKAGLSRAVYEQLHKQARLLGSCLFMRSQESVTARAGKQRDWLAECMPHLREGLDEKQLALLLSHKEAILESFLRSHNMPKGFAAETFAPVTLKGATGHEVRFTLPRSLVVEGQDEAAGLKVWRHPESGFLLLVHALPRPPAPMRPDFELLKKVVPSSRLPDLVLAHEAPPYEFGGFPNVGGVLENKEGKDRVEGAAFLVDAGAVVLLVVALESGHDFEHHFTPLTLGLRAVSVTAASPPKRKAR